MHGRVDEAEEVVKDIEKQIGAQQALPASPPKVNLEVKGAVDFRAIVDVLLKKHPKRTVLGLTLMIAQAFAYNGVFFTYSLVPSRFYGAPSNRVGLDLLPFAISNLIGPLVLGPLFDAWGRRVMIALTYGTSAVLLWVTGYGFLRGWFTATTQTVMWAAMFFVASAAASSAYLTVSELFPVELRGMAIALFYAVGTAAGGLADPALFGALVGTGQRVNVFSGYLVGAALMAIAALVSVAWGVSAERKSLEQLTEMA